MRQPLHLYYALKISCRTQAQDMVDKQLNSRRKGLVFFPDECAGCFLLTRKRTEAECAVAGGVDQLLEAQRAAGPGFHEQRSVEDEVVGADDFQASGLRDALPVGLRGARDHDGNTGKLFQPNLNL